MCPDETQEQSTLKTNPLTKPSFHRRPRKKCEYKKRPDGKNATGRPSKLTKRILEKTRQYIDTCTDEYKIVGNEKRLVVNLPTIAGLASYLKMSRRTVEGWVRKYQNFADIIDELMQKQEQILINNGLAGVYNSNITKMLLAKHGYCDRNEVEYKMPDLSAYD